MKKNHYNLFLSVVLLVLVFCMIGCRNTGGETGNGTQTESSSSGRGESSSERETTRRETEGSSAYERETGRYPESASGTDEGIIGSGAEDIRDGLENIGSDIESGFDNMGTGAGETESLSR